MSEAANATLFPLLQLPCCTLYFIVQTYTPFLLPHLFAASSTTTPYWPRGQSNEKPDRFLGEKKTTPEILIASFEEKLVWGKGEPVIMYEVCPEGIQPHHMKNRDIYWRRHMIQETLYTGQWRLSPLQSRYLGTSHSSPSHLQLPRRIFLHLIYGLKSLPFQRRF